METGIASFLLKNKYCPVGRCGSLQLRHVPAAYMAAEKMISPSRFSIEFSTAEINDEDLLHYVSRKESCSFDEARQRLDKFYDSVQNISGTREMILPGLGRFFAGPSGTLQFRQQPLPECFLPPVPAARVIRANRPVTVLVGDKEKITVAGNVTSGGKTAPETKIAWKYAAALALIASLLCIWHFSQHGMGKGLGNQAPVQTATPVPGYQKI